MPNTSSQLSQVERNNIAHAKWVKMPESQHVLAEQLLLEINEVPS